MRPVHEVLIRPCYTEKVNYVRKSGNKYIFFVNIDANKIEIAKAVEDYFGVKNKVLAVNTIILPGKVKRLSRYKGRLPDRKKAVVTFPIGVVLPNIYDDV
ncbi:MAG: 50S ribosomal protein L23 [Deltaproteobacteria bacterium]|jgi:large subunit ribosomal protein L23|nr:50S ribosomal protein L23 [Deltaproteobacteria bacterium]